MLSPESMRDELTAITSRTSRPYNVNFFCHAVPQENSEREARWFEALTPYYRELGIDPESVAPIPSRTPFSVDFVDALESFKPPVVSFHFGLPSPELVARVKSWGTTVLSSATTVDEALWLQARGVDAIVAQGWEAGGHRGIFLTDDLTTQAGTFALLPQIVRAVGIPVIAAGGIADAEGVVAAKALGATAAQVGTAYLLCPECTTSPMHRSALKSDAARHTAVTNVFTGRPARAIVNRIVRELGPISKLAPEFPLAFRAVLPLVAKAATDGLSEFTPMWAGQNVTGCKEVPAAELTQALAGD
jgi:nitronate monooxygenase